MFVQWTVGSTTVNMVKCVLSDHLTWHDLMKRRQGTKSCTALNYIRYSHQFSL